MKRLLPIIALLILVGLILLGDDTVAPEQGAGIPLPTSTPTTSQASSTNEAFRGPRDEPRVKGPSGPPPNY